MALPYYNNNNYPLYNQPQYQSQQQAQMQGAQVKAMQVIQQDTPLTSEFAGQIIGKDEVIGR